MTRSELIHALAARYTNFPQDTVEEMVKRIFSLMINSLLRGERIEIRNFGSFSLRYRKPRTARNPKNGNLLQTQGKYAVHFKPGKELRERVNNQDTN